MLDPGAYRHGLAEVDSQDQSMYPGGERPGELLQDPRGIIPAAVIDKKQIDVVLAFYEL